MFRGTLCEATIDLHELGRNVQDIPTLMSLPFTQFPVIKRGELVTYIGRIVVNGKYCDHKFLTARGVYLASPSYFKCASDAQDDENNVKP